MARVVVAEDDPDVHELVNMVLELGGHDVRMTHSGDQALAACLHDVPDLALLDVSMPGDLDGYATARRLRAEPSTQHLAIVMLTAHAQQEAQEMAVAAGADAYVVKPFDADRLLALIDDLLTAAPRRRG